MELTGKCKEDFEKWYIYKLSLLRRVSLRQFENLPDSMQWGVYLEFFESKGLIIDRDNLAQNMLIWDWRKNEPDEAFIIDCDYEEEFVDWNKSAIEICNELYNNA